MTIKVGDILEGAGRVVRITGNGLVVTEDGMQYTQLEASTRTASEQEEDMTSQPFPNGTRVRFRNDISYTVRGWDGEHLHLESEGETLYFGPEFFEVEAYPELPLGSAVANPRGDAYLVSDASDTAVDLIRLDGETVSIPRSVFHSAFRVLK